MLSGFFSDGINISARKRLSSGIDKPEPVFVNLCRSTGIDSQPGGNRFLRQYYLSYQSARLAESIPGVSPRADLRNINS
jgi:hypothetical protein